MQQVRHVLLAKAEVFPALLGRVHVVKAPNDNTINALLPTAAMTNVKGIISCMRMVVCCHAHGAAWLAMIVVSPGTNTYTRIQTYWQAALGQHSEAKAPPWTSQGFTVSYVLALCTPAGRLEKKPSSMAGQQQRRLRPQIVSVQQHDVSEQKKQPGHGS